MSALHKKLTMANCISTSDSGDRTITEQSPSEQSLQASRDECRQWFSPSAYGEVHEEEPHVQSHVHVVGVASQ